MNKVDQYRQYLRATTDWERYLLAESGLPGPRANLELVQTVADEGDEALFVRLLSFGVDRAPVNSPQEFLPLCGVVGLGRLLANGRTDLLKTLRRYAADPRWRVREGVAMALQRYGERDLGALMTAMADWAKGDRWEQRAAVAALCEPRLLADQKHANRLFDLLDGVTASMCGAADRMSESYKVLRKAMAYCWSVAVAAYPEEGKRRMEQWFARDDKDVRWLMRENLKKDRLVRMDRAWVERWKAER
jgi:hypothetical protein